MGYDGMFLLVVNGIRILNSDGCSLPPENGSPVRASADGHRYTDNDSGSSDNGADEPVFFPGLAEGGRPAPSTGLFLQLLLELASLYFGRVSRGLGLLLQLVGCLVSRGGHLSVFGRNLFVNDLLSLFGLGRRDRGRDHDRGGSLDVTRGGLFHFRGWRAVGLVGGSLGLLGKGHRSIRSLLLSLDGGKDFSVVSQFREFRHVRETGFQWLWVRVETLVGGLERRWEVFLGGVAGEGVVFGCVRHDDG
ncbi:hypothetical protein DFJ77DRAFT_475153 [Powellomyces hirtus]|nr:hypothetical protein DFJ77DRAFT_475153 [Powellomyces hirtus]